MTGLQPAEASESARQFLRASQLFAPLDDNTFEHIYEELEWIKLPLGHVLFHEGSPGDSLYILVYGRLGVRIRKGGVGEHIFINEIHPGEPIGEMAVLTEEPRSATISALRDATLVRLSRARFRKLVEQHPLTLIAMNQLLVNRLRTTTSEGGSSKPLTHIFAIIPISRQLPLEQFTHRLHQEMQRFGRVLLLNSEKIQTLGHGDLTDSQEPDYSSLLSWLNVQEQQHEAVVLQADPEPTGWTRFCTRYADALLLLGDATQRPNAYIPDERLLLKARDGLGRKRKLVLLQPDHIKLPQGTARWLDLFPVDAHHHVKMGDPKGIKRLTRYLMGKAVSVALAGGSARGFAHIGVLRALREFGIPIDLACGASAGSNFGAQQACGWDYETMLEKTRRLVAHKPFLDFDLPVVSMLGTKTIKKGLKDLFEDIYIEDLWCKYFCACSNLTRATVVLFDRGLLRDRVRASGALPGFYPPYTDQAGELLVDGAVLANLPAMYVEQFATGKLIAVNVIPTLDTNICSGLPEGLSSLRMLTERINPFHSSPYPNILDILMRSIFLNSIKDAEQIRQKADLYLEPSLGRFGFFDLQSFEIIVNIGYYSARKEIASWIERDRELQQIIDADQA